MLRPPDSGQSYVETYNRSKNLPSNLDMASFTPTPGSDRGVIDTKYSTKAILTDRGQYMSYLECQLERVTASLLAQGSLEKRMVEMDETMSKVDDRISSMTKVAKLSQVSMGDSCSVFHLPLPLPSQNPPALPRPRPSLRDGVRTLQL